MRIGTLTLNINVKEETLNQIMKVNKIDILFIQYLENPLYNITRELKVVGEHTIINNGPNYNIIKYRDLSIVQILSGNEEETWDVLDSVEDTDIILGFFNEDSDSNTHFELTFDYVDSLKLKYHEMEQYPPVTDVLNDTRTTWIITKERFETDSFEFDKLTNGVWIDVRD